MLTLLVALPLVGGLVLLALPRLGRGLALSVGLADLALAASLVLRFPHAPDLPPQFVQHRVWLAGLGLEHSFGADGVGLPGLALVPLLLCAAVLLDWERPPEHHARLLVLSSAVLGTYAALDAFELFLFFAFGFAASQWLSRSKPQLLTGCLSLVALLGAVLLLHETSVPIGPAFTLVNGTPQPGGHTFNLLDLTELGHKGLWESRAPVGHLAMARLTMALVALAAVVRLAMPPLHARANADAAALPAGAALLLQGAYAPTGLLVLVRLGRGALPRALDSFSGPLAWFAALGLLWAALASLGAPDLRRRAGSIATTQLALGVLGLASGTPQGLAGALYLLWALGLTRALLLCASSRAQTLGLLSASALPGLIGFVPWFFSVAGAFPTHVAPAGLALLGQAVLASGCVGALPARAPAPSRRERVLALVLGALAVALGVWPRPILEVATQAIPGLIR